MPIANNVDNYLVGASQVDRIYRGGDIVWERFNGLLDLFPNAAVAYSLRRLSKNYAGSAIRVRRGSDNAEQDIGFVDNELDTATLVSFIGASDGWVTTWYDQSGLGLDATQPTASVQPFIVLAGVLQELNGKPCVRFVDNSGAAVLDRLNVPLFHVNTVPYLAYFATYGLNLAAVDPYIIGGANNDRGMELLHLTSTRRLRPATIRTGGSVVANGSALTISQQYILAQTANRVRLKLYLNNVLDIDVADRNEDFNMPSPTYYMGNMGAAISITADFSISEFVAYARDVEAEISGINTNTNEFYGAY
jgi:hypothetical protein